MNYLITSDHIHYLEFCAESNILKIAIIYSYILINLRYKYNPENTISLSKLKKSLRAKPLFTNNEVCIQFILNKHLRSKENKLKWRLSFVDDLDSHAAVQRAFTLFMLMSFFWLKFPCLFFFFWQKLKMTVSEEK